MNVANFNAQVWIPFKTTEWKSQDKGILACCSPYGEGQVEECELPICDCASLAALFASGYQTKQMWNPLWWGVCPIGNYADGMAGSPGDDEAGNFAFSLDYPQSYVQTSIGLTWQQVLGNHHALQRFAKEIGGHNGSDWKDIAEEVETNNKEVEKDVRSLLVKRAGKKILSDVKVSAEVDSASPCKGKGKKDSCSDHQICQPISGYCANSDKTVSAPSNPDQHCSKVNSNDDCGHKGDDGCLPFICSACGNKYDGKYSCVGRRRTQCRCNCAHNGGR